MLLILGGVFFLLLLVFGRMKGLNTIISLTFTVLAIFTVFIPSILSGYNIYLMSLVTCFFTIIMTLLITNGAMGAVMDVAMDISSSLYEIRLHARDIGFTSLVKSGIRIGRDVMGTMANTLVLAYIGSSLCSILLLITYSSSLRELLNRESIVVEILQALIGSTAILLTIPLTAMVCGVMYTQKPKPDIPVHTSSQPSEEKPISAMTEEERQAYFFGD